MSDTHRHPDEEIWFSAVDAGSLTRFDKDAAFAAFHRRVASASQARHRRRLMAGYAAAALALAAVISIFSFRQGQQSINNQMAEIVVSVPKGARTSMVLPDGTRVWLNAESTLRYAQDFGIRDREVSLVGEGFFEVTHDEQHPFRVLSEDLDVQVLGTKFDFRDYPEDLSASVSLAEGSVSLRGKGASDQEILLAVDQKASLDKRTGKITVESHEAAIASQWTDGRLVYDGEALAAIIKDLERNYDISIEVTDDSLLGLHFFGAFLRQEQSLTEIMDALAATGRLEYKQEGRTVRLYPPKHR